MEASVVGRSATLLNDRASLGQSFGLVLSCMKNDGGKPEAGGDILLLLMVPYDLVPVAVDPQIRLTKRSGLR
jgi:hypothetical protein